MRQFLPLLLGLSIGIILNVSAFGQDDSLRAIQSKGALVWGADQEGGGPFVFPDEKDPNKLVGFEVELAG